MALEFNRRLPLEICVHISASEGQEFTLRDLAQLVAIRPGRMENIPISRAGVILKGSELGALYLAAADAGMTQIPLWKEDRSPCLTISVPPPLEHRPYEPYNSVRQTIRLDQIVGLALDLSFRELCRKLTIRQTASLGKREYQFTVEELARVYRLCSVAGLKSVPLWVAGEPSLYVKVPCAPQETARIWGSSYRAKQLL